MAEVLQLKCCTHIKLPWVDCNIIYEHLLSVQGFKIQFLCQSNFESFWYSALGVLPTKFPIDLNLKFGLNFCDMFFASEFSQCVQLQSVGDTPINDIKEGPQLINLII